ncbi:MAG: MaoC family dehydratase [Streptosporangiales bacterium]|jgi:acyl dehydratase|nr:MaoC family dehydratase [Streptosporangiales bacterium]
MTDRRMGMWFEELTVGTVVEHAITRTVTETDNVMFTTMSMNPQPLHLDADFSAKTQFGKPLFNSLFTLAIAVGISVPELTLGTTVANLGFSQITFPNPVFAGDTLHVTSEVTAARLSSSRPGVGIVTFVHVARNQDDKIVCQAERQAMMHCRPKDDKPAEEK